MVFHIGHIGINLQSVYPINSPNLQDSWTWRNLKWYCIGPYWPKPSCWRRTELTHWGRVTHICVSKLTSNGSDNGLSPGRRQTIIWTNACILLIGPLGTNFSEILIEILTFSSMKMRLKVSSAKWPFCLGLNVLRWMPDEFVNTITQEVLGVHPPNCLIAVIWHYLG